ncbi:hypothetical protein [Acinetobacter bereziniae]|nr:hypothetical protein [Acinetobacter bereziniae]
MLGEFLDGLCRIILEFMVDSSDEPKKDVALVSIENKSDLLFIGVMFCRICWRVVV